MSLTISGHTEARLTEEARKQGISVDALLEKLINDHAELAATPTSAPSDLPKWHLGGNTSLRRRDIYNDVR